jgi:hypothetical protein
MPVGKKNFEANYKLGGKIQKPIEEERDLGVIVQKNDESV